MPVLFMLIFALLALFIVFLFLPMQFGIHYIKTASKNKFYIYVSLFGILIRIPIHTMKDAKKEKKQITFAKENQLTFHVFRKNVDTFGEVAEIFKNELLEMLSYVRKHITCKELDFRIAFGTGDAAKTGITTGAVWTSGTLLLKILDSLIGIKNMHMDVFPDFQQKRFEISLKTILIMQPFRFIIVYKSIRDTIKFIKTKISNLK